MIQHSMIQHSIAAEHCSALRAQADRQRLLAAARRTAAPRRARVAPGWWRALAPQASWKITPST